MTPGAQTPEELETMLEDAFLIGDGGVLQRLFEPDALLAADGLSEARGRGEIVRFAGAIWSGDHLWVAQPSRVLQAGDTALVVARQATSVVRRNGDGAWRYAISLLQPETTTERNDYVH